MVEYATLGSLITPAKVIRCENGNYPVLSMTMHNGIVLQSERFKKSLASVDQSEYKVVKRGQLVIGFPIDEGVLYIQKAVEIGIMSPAYNIWEVDATRINPDFLELCLHSPQSMQYYKNKLRGTTARRRSIPTADLLALRICIPDMDVQCKTVTVLKQLNSLIDKRKQQLIKLDELVKARFVEMFGDPKENPNGYRKEQLKKTCNVITGNTPSRTVDAFYGDHIEWIKTDNIVRGLLYPTTAAEYLSEKGMAISRTVEKGSILMVCIAGSVSSIGRICVTDRKVAFNQQINAIVPSKYYILFLYVLLQLLKEYLVEEINMSLKGILSKSKLEEKTFIVPPMELQEQFAAFVEQTNKSKLTIQQSLDKMEVLKKSLMQEYFG